MKSFIKKQKLKVIDLMLRLGFFKKDLESLGTIKSSAGRNFITVYTSIVGKKDHLIDNQETSGAVFLAFTDQSSNTWKTLKPYDKFKDPRRNSRIVKMMPHLFFDSEYSIWMDGNYSLALPAQFVIEKFLKEKDIAVWKHPNRDCIYDEANACYQQEKDTAEALLEQTQHYKKIGFPKNSGLYAGGIIIRRHTERINRLNERWWAEYCRFSTRDQICLRFIFPNEEVNIIDDGTIWDNPYFRRIEHVTDF